MINKPPTQYIEINNKKIAYIDWNSSSNETIICIHGINRNKHDFDYLADYLSKYGFRVITIDMQGRGESEYLDNYSEYSYETYREFLIDFINKLDIKQFSLIGTSMGGIISIILGQVMHNRVKTIVINDIGPHTDSVALKIISKYVCNYTEFNSIEEVSKYIRIFLRPLNIKSNEHWDHMIKYSVKKTKNNSYVLDFDPQILVNFKNNANKNRDIWSIWNDIDRKIPILILRGEKSIMLTKETLLKMLESKDQIDFIEYSDVGHTPSLLEIQQLEDIKNWITKKLSQQK